MASPAGHRISLGDRGCKDEAVSAFQEFNRRHAELERHPIENAGRLRALYRSEKRFLLEGGTVTTRWQDEKIGEDGRRITRDRERTQSARARYGSQYRELRRELKE